MFLERFADSPALQYYLLAALALRIASFLCVLYPSYQQIHRPGEAGPT